jgi:RecJ-like exonuclease
VGYWERTEVQEPQVGGLPHLQRHRENRVSDRLTCPDCDGTGRQALGPLQLACRFCHGYGYIGDDHEPAEEQPAPSIEAAPPVWESPAVRTLTVCKVCLGAKTVVNLGGTGEPTGYLVQMPCPACSNDHQRQDDEEL